MKKQWFAITITVATATTALLVLFWLMGDISSGISTPALAAPLSPTVTAVDPAVAPNDIDTPIVIQGTGFTATLSGTQVITAPTVYLGDERLVDVVWANTTTLSATVPWGLIPDVYPLTVVNPDGISATLQNAFTVTNGVGVFTTDGPYGGYVLGIEKKPGTPTTVYALAGGVGLFVSEDSGAHWEPSLVNEWSTNLAFDAQDGNVIYYGRDTWLYRTMDGGDTWERLWILPDIPGGRPCNMIFPAAHPSLGQVVYAGIGCSDSDPAPGEAGVFRSDDYGITWITKTNGMTDTDVHSIAIHPNDPDKMLAGTWDGNLYVSTDGGENWSFSAHLDGPVIGVYFNPYQPLEAWASASTAVHDAPYLYTSTNLTDWTPVVIDPGAAPGGWPNRWNLTFLTDTIWASSMVAYTSTDGGASWAEVPGLHRGANVVAVTPENPQEIYVGHGIGVDKSEDGGQTWQQINEGLAGLVPSAVATSPIDPDLVFARTFQGLYRSFNGGRAWQDLGCCGGGGGAGGNLAIDTYTPTRIYLGAHITCNDDQFCIEISPDSGDTWDIVTATLPVTYTGFGGGDADVVAPHPLIPGRMLAGSNVQDSGNSDNHFGMVYASDDYGQNWAYMEPTQPISRTVDIAYDAVDPDLVYMATAGSGLWKSTDGGASWQSVSAFPGIPFISSVAAHPDAPSTVYVLAEDGAGSNLYVSEDAGDTWTHLTDECGVQVIVASSQPAALYTSCGAFTKGTCRSTDGGQTWNQVLGVPRPTALATGSDGGRVAVYVGSPGGLASQAGVQTAATANTILGDVTIFGGGVYRLTTLLPTEFVYLPIIMR